jgi:hypothetical protein
MSLSTLNSVDSKIADPKSFGGELPLDGLISLKMKGIEDVLLVENFIRCVRMKLLEYLRIEGSADLESVVSSKSYVPSTIRSGDQKYRGT